MKIKRKKGSRNTTHFRFQLKETVAKCRFDIEKIQVAGSYPHDYSLGWTNALIFCEHRLEGHSNKPRFYTQKTSIGEVPRPVTFQLTEEQQADEAYYEKLIDDILEDVDALIKTPFLTDVVPRGLIEQFACLNDSYAKLIKFLEEKEDAVQSTSKSKPETLQQPGDLGTGLNDLAPAGADGDANSQG